MCWRRLVITPHTRFHCEAYILTKAGGRASHAVFRQLPPQFSFRTTM